MDDSDALDARAVILAARDVLGDYTIPLDSEVALDDEFATIADPVLDRTWRVRRWRLTWYLKAVPVNTVTVVAYEPPSDHDSTFALEDAVTVELNGEEV